MKEHPISFTNEMVEAILEGRKSQTRRVLKPMNKGQSEWLTEELLHQRCKEISLTIDRSTGIFGAQLLHPRGGPIGWIECPYGQVGDLLWVRETWAKVPSSCQWRDLPYRLSPCGDYRAYYRSGFDRSAPKWLSCQSMPRWASRLTLGIKKIRVEKVADITESEARAEGVEEGKLHRCYPSSAAAWVTSYCKGFEDLWNSIHTKRGYSWEQNPWVWVIEFQDLASQSKYREEFAECQN